MSAWLLHNVCDITNIPIDLLSEDISLIGNVDIHEVDLLKACSVFNQTSERIKYILEKHTRNNYLKGFLYFDNRLIVSFEHKGKPRELHKLVHNEQEYINFINYLCTFYPYSEEDVPLEEDKYSSTLHYSIMEV